MSYSVEMYPHEHAYLALLNKIEREFSGMSGFYGLDTMRECPHKEILEHISWNIGKNDTEVYIRSKRILTNLGVAIGFNPPEHIGKSAYELHRLLECQEGYYFLTRKIDRLHTNYGVITV